MTGAAPAELGCIDEPPRREPLREQLARRGARAADRARVERPFVGEAAQ